MVFQFGRGADGHKSQEVIVMKERNCFRDFFRYTSLNMLGMLALSCYILADTFFVSQGMGTDGLTALNLAIPVYSFIHGSGLMIGMGGATRYSIQESQGNIREGNRIFTGAVCLAGVFSLLFLLVGWMGVDGILLLFGAEGTVYSMSRVYLQVILFFSPAFLMNNLLLCFVRNDGAPQLSMAAMLGGSFSNVVLDWVFVFPCGMGIFGAAFATGLAPVLSMLILSPHFFRKRNGFRFSLSLLKERDGMGVKRERQILSSGVPSLVSEVSSGVVMIVFNSIFLKLEGNIGVAAYGIIANLSLVVLSLFTGIAQGIQPILSRSYGAEEWLRIRRTLQYAVASVCFLSVLLYGVLWAQTSQIVGLFNAERNEALQKIAEEGLRLYFIACPFAGLNIVLAVYFTSVNRPRPAHVVSFLRGFLVILPMAFLLSRTAGVPGTWCSFPVSECVVFLVGTGLLVRHARREKKGNRAGEVQRES